MHLPAKAARSGSSPRTRSRRRNLEQIRKHKRVELAEVAEEHLIQAVREGKQWVVERVLKTIGRELGYGDQTALTSGDGRPLISDVRVTVKYVGGGDGESLARSDGKIIIT